MSLKNLSVFACFLAFVSLCLSSDDFTEKQDDTRTRHPWSISFKVFQRYQDSETQNGTIEMVLRFDDQMQESFIVPDDTFEIGKIYKYQVTFSTYSKMQMAFIRTSGMCKKPLELEWIDFLSETNGNSYSKMIGVDMPIKDKCTGPVPTGLKDFHETLKSLYCIDDGKRYENGEGFIMGCNARCSCHDGLVSCVDMCPPFGVISNGTPFQKVNVAGECCQRVTSEDKWKNGDCERPDLKRFGAEFNNGYPSAVYVCSDKECNEERVSAVLISNNWALAPLVENWSVSESRLFIARSSDTGIRRFAVEQIVSNVSAQLTMFKLADFAVGISLTTQYANLPLNTNQCQEIISRKQCPFTMVGWNFVNGVENPTIETVAGNSVDADQCSNSAALCLSHFSSNSPCRMLHGGPAYVQIDKDINYLVGMKNWRTKKLNDCNPVSLANEQVINLCSSLSWIDKILVSRPN